MFYNSCLWKMLLRMSPFYVTNCALFKQLFKQIAFDSYLSFVYFFPAVENTT